MIVDGGMLDLAGPGTSTFQLQGAARLEGTVAPDQVVATFSSPSGYCGIRHQRGPDHDSVRQRHVDRAYGQHARQQGGDSARAVLNVDSATTLDPTATTLTSSEPVAGYGRAFTSHYGQPVTLMATVRQDRGPRPGGQVIFYDSMNNVLGYTLGTAVLGTADLSDVDGVATAKLTMNALGVGLHDIVAFYAGDAHSLAATSKDYTQQVAPDATIVRLIAPAASAFGRAATLRAVVLPSLVGPASPTGDIVFYGQGAASTGGCASRDRWGYDRSGAQDHRPPPATQNLVAIYLGDGSYAESTSPVNYRGLPPRSVLGEMGR